MSEWMLYHAFGIRGYEIVRQEKFDRHCLSFSLRAKPEVLRCPRCGTKDVVRKGTNPRLFRGLSVGSQVTVHTPVGSPAEIWTFRMRGNRRHLGHVTGDF